MTPHPSFLALDRVALGVAEADVVAHVGGCPQCAAHVAGLETTEPLPDWALALEHRGGWSKRWVAAAALVALAAGVLAMLTLGPTGPGGNGHADPYVAIKGHPTVRVFLRREGQVREIHAGATLRHGDALRLGVSAPGFVRVTITDPTVADGVLYEGPLPAEPDGLLPTSFAVDGGSETETLHLHLAPADPRETPWTTTLSFSKDAR